jgi:hypothetical protein
MSVSVRQRTPALPSPGRTVEVTRGGNTPLTVRPNGNGGRECAGLIG